MSFALRLTSGFKARGADSNRKSGSAAVEFALVAPVLLLLMSGIYAYGGYFLTAHTVQQLANDAARAAIAGLDNEERLSLAQQAAQAGLENQPFMRGDMSELSLAQTGSAISFRVTYDASDDMYWAFSTLLPLPPSRISRTATIRLGGL